MDNVVVNLGSEIISNCFSSMSNRSTTTPTPVTEKKQKTCMEKIRSFRIFEIAFFDLFITFFFAGMFDMGFRLYNIFIYQPIFYLSLMPMSVFIHMLIGVQTGLIRKLLEPNFNIQKWLICMNLLALLYFITLTNMNT